MKTPVITIEGYFRALSPLSHSFAPAEDEDRRNEVPQRVLDVVSRDGLVVQVPAYSGNAVRGATRRELFSALVEACNIEHNSIHPAIALLLTSGGGLKKKPAQRNNGGTTIEEAKEREDKEAKLSATERAAIFRLLPAISLLGGSHRGRILEGKTAFDIWVAMSSSTPPEAYGYYDDIFEEIDLDALPEPNALVSTWRQSTRRGDLTEVYTSEQLASFGTDRTIFPYGFGYAPMGTLFMGAVYITAGTNEVEQSALRLGLERVFQTNAFFGQHGAVGFGRIKTTWSTRLKELPESAIFIEYVKANKKEILELLKEGKVNV